MKKILMLLCAGALMSALCAGFVACNDNGERPGDVIIHHSPDVNCFVFYTTIPGEETILLAKRGIAFYDGLAMLEDYELEYGKDNVRMSVNFPDQFDIMPILENRSVAAHEPDPVLLAMPSDCYEITMTIELAYFVIPYPEQLKEMLLSTTGMSAVRIIDDIAICKIHDWAFTEENAEKLIPYHENMFYKYHSGAGQIVSTTIKKLGPEIHNEPVLF